MQPSPVSAPEPLRCLDLFSGVGGFSRGLEALGGFRTVAFCEIEAFRRDVLRKHWPGVPIYHDIRELSAARLRADGLWADMLTGGFPCEDISLAGRGAGLDGARSGLWREFARLLGDIRPRYALVENSAALSVRGLSAVLGDLAALGYDAEWHCIPASRLGAPHERDRLWLIAYPSDSDRGRGAAARDGADADQPRLEIFFPREEGELPAAVRNGGWAVEPGLLRVAFRVPDRIHRIEAIGASVVPQVVACIGDAILRDAARTRTAG